MVPLDASGDESLSISAVVIAVVAFVLVVILFSMIFVFVFTKKENTALKIKSPNMILLFLGANMLFIFLLTLVYLNAEVCGAIKCNVVLEDVARIAGYAMVCLAEPLIMLAYLMRYVRIQGIFKAQEQYYLTKEKPEAMIEFYSEALLSMIAIGGTGIFTIVYMGVGLPTTFALDDGYGYLPTYNLSLKDGNDHMYISLIYFCCITFIEGLCLAYFLDQMRLIKKDFNMLQELQIFTLCWVLLTEFVLFMIIQGLSAEWMTNVQYYRLMFYVILLRQLLIVLATTAKPIYQAFKNSVYFAIPANHECIDSVDMVLHIPIAVDAFYQYLISRHEHMKDK